VVKTRAPYEAQIEELETAGMVKFFKKHNIYAVLAVQEIPIYWKKNGRECQEIDTLTPGMVLYPRPRGLSKWERELSEEEEKLFGINLEWNQVRVVYRFPDLWGAIRQRGRHIIDNLIERRIPLNKETEAIIPGEAKRMKDLSLLLNDFTNRFLRERITPQLEKSFFKEISPVHQELETARDEFKVKATQLLEEALEEKGVKRAAKSAEALAKILNRWVEVIEIVSNSLKQAENWLLLCREIEMKVSWAYKRLAKLAEELSEMSGFGQSPQPAKLKEIANEFWGILIYLNREVLFNPYYQRVGTPEVQNLAKAKKYAKEGKEKKILNLAKQTLSKLGAIVLKEKPTSTEILRRKRSLPRG
jgi:hypothetical protein